jgi:hypothetical protein
MAGSEGVLRGTVEAAGLMHVLSEVLLTVKVYVPGTRPGNVGLVWYPEPTLYSTPDCVVKTIVPVGVEQVGCVTPDTVGTGGGTAAVRVTVDAAALIHVLSVMLLTVRV